MPSFPSRLGNTLRHLLQNLVSHQEMNSAFPIFIKIPDDADTTANDIVPLAAFLLEYPVAYVPEDPQQVSFLSSVELVVYSCSLLFDSKQEAFPTRHRFIQFSCPRVSLPENANIEGELRQKFTNRIRQIGMQCALEVTSRTERFDRVAL